MLVKDRMTANPYCISKDTSISAALDLMAERDFHRIPVAAGQELVGLVTEGTIAENTPSKATSLSVYELNYLLAKSTVESVMIKDVVTIHPDALLEEAAVLMRQHDIGCLVVTEGRKVVGIITQNDIFEAFIDLLGYYEEGSRYVIAVEDKPGVLAAIAAEFAKNGVSINGVNQDLKPTMTDPGYDGEIQQLRVVTHLTDEETLRNTVKAVQALDFVTGDPSILRVLD